METTFGTDQCEGQVQVPVMGDDTRSTAVWVDWDLVDQAIENSGVDLQRYNDSSLWYMAAQLGHSWQSMKRIRRTGSTTLKTLAKMSDVLGCSPFDLLKVEPGDDFQQ